MSAGAGRGAYGDVVLEHFRRPRNHGRLAFPDVCADGANALCGDRVRFEIALSGDAIADARFSGNACALCTASASLLTEWLRGRRLVDAVALPDEEALSWLGGEVPASRRRCALLPAETVRRALERVVAARRVVGVVLAAGRGRRFGAQKLVAPLAGVPIVRRAVGRMAAEVDEVVVVVAPDDAAVREAIAPLGVRVVENAEAGEGLGASIRAGVRAVRERAAAVVIALGDQPGLPAGVVVALRDAYLGAPRGSVVVVAPRYRGARGHPVLFGAAAFDELLSLAGDVGARSVLEREPSRVCWVDVDADPPADVDTPDDLAAMASWVEPASR